MSLLDRGPHQVTVRRRIASSDSMGETWTAGPAVVLQRVAVQPLTADEIEQLGVASPTAYMVIGRGRWPGGPLSQVHVDIGPRVGWFDQHGEARYYGMSPRTSHFDVVITARGTESR